MTSGNGTRDGYVRIPTPSLPGIDLRHLTSGKDLSIAVDGDPAATTVTGYTEWVGSWENLPITIGWDWGVSNGVVIVLNTNEIRTNILPVSPDGVPEREATAKAHLLRLIESTPWRDIAIQHVDLDDHF